MPTLQFPSRMLGESAKEALAVARRGLRQAEAALGSAYVRFISGIGLEFAHHSCRGRQVKEMLTSIQCRCVDLFRKYFLSDIRKNSSQ